MVEWKKLGEIGEVCMCKRIMKHQTFDKGDVPFYKIGTFGSTADAFINRDLYNDYKAKYSFPHKGDILLSAAGTIGRTVVYNGEDAYFQDSNIVWISNDESQVTNEFLFYSYQVIDWKIDGGTIKRLYNYNLKNAIIPIPSLSEQQRIVGILDTFTASIDNLKEQIAQRRKQYEYYRDQLLDLEGKEGVEMKTLSSFGDVTKLAGFEFTEHVTYQDSGSIIALRGLNVRDGKLDLLSVKYIDGSNFSKLNRSKLVKGDMLFTYVGTIGNVALIEENEKYYLAPNVSRIRFNNDVVNPKFALYYFMSDYFKRTQIGKYMNSSSMKNLSMENIRKFELNLPSLGEQSRIVSILDTFESSIANLESQLSQREKQYEYYRNKLLTFE